MWHVNATAHGGGVAEMLQTLLAYGKGAGIENRWLVLDGDPTFFAITKRLHNMLHGEPGDGGSLGHRGARALRGGARAPTSRTWSARVSPRDIVLLHDPQTAGVAAGLREMGARVVWRCHVGRDLTNDHNRVAWEFLRPYLGQAQAMVFSRREYAPEWVEESGWSSSHRRSTRSPSRTCTVTRGCRAVLAGRGLVEGGGSEGPVDSRGATARPARCGPIAAPVDS